MNTDKGIRPPTKRLENGKAEYRGVVMQRYDDTPQGYWGRWRTGVARVNGTVTCPDLRAGSMKGLKSGIDKWLPEYESKLAEAKQLATMFNRSLVHDTTDVLQRENCGAVYVELAYYLNHRTGEAHYAVTLYDMAWGTVDKGTFPTVNLNTAIDHYNRSVLRAKAAAAKDAEVQK